MKKEVRRTAIIFLWLFLFSAGLGLPHLLRLGKDAREIHLFSWGGAIHASVLQAFEQETGIKVRQSFYSSNEELLVKLKATEGVGYDLILPSDYAVAHLVNAGLLKPLDKRRIGMMKSISPFLLHRSYDPHNLYALPFAWEVYGLGVDRSSPHLASIPKSWKALFDSKLPYRITMVNDPLEAASFAAFHLFHKNERLTPAELVAAGNLLREQRHSVEAYVDSRSIYFLETKNCPVVLTSSSSIWQARKHFPRNAATIGFVIPEEGTFVTIENLAIPRASTKDDLVYTFIDFLFRPESLKAHLEFYGYVPAALSRVAMTQEQTEWVEEMTAAFHKASLFRPLMPASDLQELWVEVKSEE